jgi:general secretion pathway protein L
MNLLRIYFSSQWRDSSSHCPWALCDESGAVLQQGFSPLAFMPRAPECIGIIASDRVLFFTAAKPPGNKRRWQAALPFIAEEHTLSEPDEIHAAAAESQEAGKIAVSVMAKPWLKQIIIATASLPLRRLIAESLIPALPAGGWTLVMDGQNGFLRTSLNTAIALDCADQQTPPLALKLSLKAAASHIPSQIELRFLPSDQTAVLPAWDLPMPLVHGKTWDWTDAPISDATPNLLCGDFRPTPRLFDGLSKMRPVLFILIAVFLIEVVGTHLEWIKLAGEKQALMQNMEHIFRNTFGDESTLVDAPLQMQRNLAGLRHAAGVVDDADFIALLDRTAPLLGKSVHSLNYESGRLELDVKLATSQDFDRLETSLKNKALKVRISDMHNTNNGRQAKLAITLEGL